jgi:hypothetical protein
MTANSAAVFIYLKTIWLLHTLCSFISAFLLCPGG